MERAGSLFFFLEKVLAYRRNDGCPGNEVPQQVGSMLKYRPGAETENLLEFFLPGILGVFFVDVFQQLLEQFLERLVGYIVIGLYIAAA